MALFFHHYSSSLMVPASGLHFWRRYFVLLPLQIRGCQWLSAASAFGAMPLLMVPFIVPGPLQAASSLSLLFELSDGILWLLGH